MGSSGGATSCVPDVALGPSTCWWRAWPGGPFEHDAVRYANEALALDLFRETVYVQLMRLHMGRGNRAEALQVYEHCRAVLADELGVTPSARTEATYREVLGP